MASLSTFCSETSGGVLRPYIPTASSFTSSGSSNLPGTARRGLSSVDLPVVSTCQRAAFTLVELLVVIAIIGILVALLLPAVQAAREAARRIQCTNHLKQVALAVHNFHSARNAVPPAYLDGTGHGTWLVLILPYVEQAALYDLSNIECQYHGLPDEVIKDQIPFYYCPTRRSPPQLSVSGDGRGSVPHRPGTLNDYAICAGDGSAVPWWATYPGGGNGLARSTHIFDPPPVRVNGTHTGSTPNLKYTGWTPLRKFSHVTDGLSNTFLAGEKYVNPEHWGESSWGDSTFRNDDGGVVVFRMAGPAFPIVRPNLHATIPNTTSRASFGSEHPGGICMFAMGDGSVREIDPAINTTILGFISNIHDGMAYDSP